MILLEKVGESFMENKKMAYASAIISVQLNLIIMNINYICILIFVWFYQIQFNFISITKQNLKANKMYKR